MNNLNRLLILTLLLGIIYVLYLYQQWTLEEDIKEDIKEDLSNDAKQLDYVEESDSDLIDMSKDIYKQDSDLESSGSDGLSFLDQQTNVSNSSLFF